MKIRIIAAGKIKDKWLKQGIEDYARRIRPYMDLEVIEVPDASDSKSEERAKAEESERLLAKVKPGFVLALDLAGEEMDSLCFAKRLQSWLEAGGATLNILIAGSLGFAPELLQKADARLSLGRMTYPHQLARLLLLEQIYRACKINRGERYHK